MKHLDQAVPARTTGLAALGVGALLALAVGWWRLGCGDSRATSPAVHVWLCDRDAQAVVGLNRDGFEVVRRAVEWPLEVAPLPGGGFWVLSALAAGPDSDLCLRRLNARGEISVERELPRARGHFRAPGDAARLRMSEDGESCTVEVLSTGARARELRSLLTQPKSKGVGPIQGFPTTPPAAATIDDRGQLWVLTPGSCQRFDRGGSPLPGQGGFDHLVSIALVPRGQGEKASTEPTDSNGSRSNAEAIQ